MITTVNTMISAKKHNHPKCKNEHFEATTAMQTFAWCKGQI